jgi:hypothetical protein
LIFHRKGCYRNNPPQAKGSNNTIRNPIEKNQAFVSAEIIERKKKGKNYQKGKMTENKERIDKKRISDNT